jgi:hypothetical protein
MTAQDLVTVYEVQDAVEAEIIKNALTVEGIRCVLGGEEQASVAAVPGTKVQIQVAAADAVQAREFIKAHEHASKEDTEVKRISEA